jgi:hypothetical protein
MKAKVSIQYICCFCLSAYFDCRMLKESVENKPNHYKYFDCQSKIDFADLTHRRAQHWMVHQRYKENAIAIKK